MNDVYTVIIEKDEDGYYVGSIPALPGCHTQAKSVDQLMERMEEAVSLWLEVEKASDLRFVVKRKITILLLKII